jgi:hypothetical protein
MADPSSDFWDAASVAGILLSSSVMLSLVSAFLTDIMIVCSKKVSKRIDRERMRSATAC